jgi:uncharacterized protein YukE
MGGQGPIKVDPNALRHAASSLANQAGHLQEISAMLHQHSAEIQSSAGFSDVADACQIVIARISIALHALEQASQKGSSAFKRTATTYEKTDAVAARLFHGGGA